LSDVTQVVDKRWWNMDKIENEVEQEVGQEAEKAIESG
jgi:hypothetical protein